MKITPIQKEIMLDSLMYSTLFYILASPKMYSMTSGMLPKLVKDRVLLHALVFMLVYVLIQKLTKRF
jgi:hypothetical protein